MSTAWKRQADKLDPDVPDKFGYTLRSRTEKAEGPVNVYMEEDYEQAMVDLLTDLMHLADREGEDFEELLSRARGHYKKEVDGEL